MQTPGEYYKKVQQTKLSFTILHIKDNFIEAIKETDNLS